MNMQRWHRSGCKGGSWVNETRYNSVKHNYQREEQDVRDCIIHSTVSPLLECYGVLTKLQAYDSILIR